MTLGGRAADMILGNGANTGAEDDLAQATSMLRNALERQGLGKGLAHMPELGLRQTGVADLVEEQLGRLLKRAVAILEADRALALSLADRLIAERILSGAEVAHALSQVPARGLKARIEVPVSGTAGRAVREETEEDPLAEAAALPHHNPQASISS
jgi:ATP-dependent Zn protease